MNLRKVGDLMEEIIAELRSRHVAGQLEIHLPLAEFRMRYGIMYTVPAESSA